MARGSRRTGRRMYCGLLAMSVSLGAAAQTEPSPASASPTEAAAPESESTVAQQPDPGGTAPADEGQPLTDEQRQAMMAAFEASLGFHGGDIELGDGLASLSVPDSFRYTDPDGASKLLQAWGNPPDAETLGMLLPRGVGVFADDSWAVVIRYTEDGHVSDEDAADLDFAELLRTMQEGTVEANEERQKAGYPAVELVGWAEPPHYDATEKKLYWAKELKFEGGEENTLNYSVRVLGRKGVLELNAVGSMPQLGQFKRSMPELMRFVAFRQGNRYSDFDPDLDEVAAYGIGALIAGKVAAKVGLFKGLVALLIASKKLLIGAVVALGASVKALLGGRNVKRSMAEATAAAGGAPTAEPSPPGDDESKS